MLRDINKTIDSLEQGMRTQKDIDSAFDDWCNIVKSSMYSNIPYKTIVSDKSYCSKKHRQNKLWWTTELTVLWTKLANAEKQWLKCSNRADKVVFKSIYVGIRKQFDTEVIIKQLVKNYETLLRE